MLNMCKALGSNPSTEKRKKGRIQRQNGKKDLKNELGDIK
jgi:hypothetical protein